MTNMTAEQALYNAEMKARQKATLLGATKDIKSGDLFAGEGGVFTAPEFFQVIEKKGEFVKLQKINHQETKIPTRYGICITPLKNDFAPESKPIRRKLKNRRIGNTLITMNDIYVDVVGEGSTTGFSKISWDCDQIAER